MKFKILIIFLFICSCASNSTKLSNKAPFTSMGFAYIFNYDDYESKIIKGKLDNSQLQVAHNSLRANTLIKIINPQTKDYLVLKNIKKINYPDFYKILITDKVASELKLNKEIPFVEITEIKKNKSFIAKKAKIFNEEKKIPSKAPVASVQISNISKDKKKNIKKNVKRNNFSILIGTFYSENVAKFLVKRITKELPNFDVKNLKIIKKNNKQTSLISGPYKTINFLKNDYILLKKFGFEELDIINE